MLANNAMLSSEPKSPVHIGRYELLGVIGTGGMGRIYLARVSGEGGFEREVALKVMHSHLLAEEEFVAMFLDEARLAARIRHPNVVSTLDVQKTPEALFLVMDVVEGLSLAELTKRRRQSSKRGSATAGDRAPDSPDDGRGPKRYEPIPVPVASRIAIDMLKGLHAAHQLADREGHLLNLVHRDVSPGNVLIGKDGIARITDFGVARAETRLTATIGGQIKGKIPYMPPEQLVADNVDRRADVYAAGVVLWEMLTGRRLFRNKNQGALIREILGGARTRPGQLQPDVPRTLDETCMRALAIDLTRRYPTAAELANEIKSALRKTGRQEASSEEVASFVAEYGTNLEHMEEARRSAPSISGVDLIGMVDGTVSSMTPSSLSGQPQLVSGASNITPPPLPPQSGVPQSGAEFTPTVTSGPSSASSLGSTTLPGAQAAPPASKSSRTLLVALAAAVVGGGIAIAAYQSGSSQAPASSASAATAPADTAPDDSVPPETATAATAEPTATATAEPSAAEEEEDAKAEEDAKTKKPAPRRPRRPRRKSTSEPKEKDEPEQAPALSEQLPTEL